MAITTADQFFTAACQAMRMRKNALGTSGSNANDMSTWAAPGIPVAGTLDVGNTTTGVLFDDTYTGAPAIDAFGSGNTGYLARVKYRNTSEGNTILYDRLWGAGSISLLSSATTTFSSQPSYTGRLPGGNDYGNLEIMLEMVTAASTGTGATVSVGYTNESGTTGRTTNSIVTSNFSPSRFSGGVVRLSLQDGDRGVQKIDSIAVTAGALTTGTCNVLVARRLAMCELRMLNKLDTQAYDALGMPQIFDTSCLWAIAQGTATTTGALSLELEIING